LSQLDYQETQEKLLNSIVTATIDGKILDMKVKKGSVVKVGDELLTLGDPSQELVKLNLSILNATKVKPNQLARINVIGLDEQPLFRGFGIDVNRASIEIARLNEANNILALKSTIVNTITNAIQRYRALLRAQEQLKIGQLALESAKRQLEIRKAFVEAGRRAPVDIVEPRLMWLTGKWTY